MSSRCKSGNMDLRLSRHIIPFSEALDEAGFGIFNYVLILLGGLVLTNVWFETGSSGFIISVIGCDLELTNENKGVLCGIGFAGIIVSSCLWGFLADTRGRRAVIMPTLLIGFVVTVLSSFTHRFWVLVVFRFINGFIVSGGSATIYAYIGEFHTDRTRPRALIATSFVFFVGSMSLPLIAWTVINNSWSLPMPFLGIVYKPWRLFILVCGILGIVCGLALLVLPESPKFLLSVGRDNEAIAVLKRMHKWNGRFGELKIDEIIPEKDTTVQKASSKSLHFLTALVRTMWEQTAPIFQSRYLRSTLIVCIIQFWIYVTIHGMYMWFPYITDAVVDFMEHNPRNNSLICDVFYNKQHMANQENSTNQCSEMLEDSTYIYSLVMEIMFCVGFFVVGIIVNKVRRIHILFVTLVVCGICGVLINYVKNPSVAMDLYVAHFISAVAEQVLIGITVELYPTHLRGMALCISLMFGRLGGVVGVYFVGLLITDNCEVTFYISGIATIVCGFLSYLIPKKLTFKDDNVAFEKIELPS